MRQFSPVRRRHPDRHRDETHPPAPRKVVMLTAACSRGLGELRVRNWEFFLLLRLIWTTSS